MEFGESIMELMEFSKCLLDRLQGGGTPVFLCVGSDKFVCDSVAPIVAEILKNEYNIGAYVYGGLDYNVNATNLSSVVNYIETVHPNCNLIVIDATLDVCVGKIKLVDGCYGARGKCLPIRKIGTTSILAVVGRKAVDFDLNSVKLCNVVRMARFISQGCYLAVSRFQKINSTKID